MQKKQKDQSAKIARRKKQNKINAAKCWQLSNAEKKFMFFLMALSTKALTKIIVISDYSELGDPEFIQVMGRYHTDGDTDVTTPPVIDSIFQGYVKDYVKIYQLFKAKPQGATKPQVILARLAVAVAYKKNTGYISGVANDVALAAGSVSAGEAVVLRCGCAIGSKGVKPPKGFKVTPGKGCVDISTKAVATKAGYGRQYGITPQENVPPTVCSEIVFTLEADVHIGKLKSFAIYGFRETSVLPVRRTTKSSSSIISIEKLATPTIATKAHKVVFNDGDTNYVWVLGLRGNKVKINKQYFNNAS